jgi:DMSO/TMAO reductase YedYZ heme-binding membrane subunit
MNKRLAFFDPVYPILFRVHDFLSDLLGKHSIGVKRSILVVAHVALLGVFVPELRRNFGSTAEAVLFVILFVSPIAGITRMKLAFQVLGFRRELGILMGYFALVHGTGYFIDSAYYSAFIAPGLSSGSISGLWPAVLLGMIALLLTMPLLLTSNRFSLGALGSGRWKKLHYLVYPMFVIVEIHRVRWSADTMHNVANVLQVSMVLGSYFLLKLLAWKRDLFPRLREPIGFIGGKYCEYVSERS